MTREKIKEAAEVMQAFTEGKAIQYRRRDSNDRWLNWINDCAPSFDWLAMEYRIKPDPKYRPFKTQEECWEEMYKHSDFGWVVTKDSKIMYHICVVGIGYVVIDSMSPIFSEAFADYEFTDGTPFGIKEEEQILI